jgi:pimeloyl-ACP methyl ester carboxylesterase
MMAEALQTKRHDTTPFVRLESRHRKQILAHLLELNSDDRAMRFGSVESDQGITDYVSRINFNRDPVLGIEKDGRVLALAHVAVFQENGYPVGDVGISVSPEARGAGYGVAIMQHSLELAASKRITKMHVQFLWRNHRMGRICARLNAPIEIDTDEATAEILLYPKDEFHYCEHTVIGQAPHKIEVFFREPKAPIGTILMCHGAGGDGWQFRDNMLTYFASHGYRAISLSMRHHGESSASGELQMQDYERDLDAVVAHYGAPDILVGHSLGGLLVQRYMEKHDIAHGVLLASIPPLGFSDPSFVQTLKAGLRCDWSVQVVDRALAGRLAVASPDRVSGKIHVMGGIHDRVVPLAWIRRTADAYQVDPTILESGHNMMQGANWLQVANAILDQVRAPPKFHLVRSPNTDSSPEAPPHEPDN